MAARVHFLTGFLGTGKTTLVNALLDLYRDRRVAVLVNEFGSTGVDSHRIHAPDVTELNNGQIFCSCVSGQFVDAMLRILRMEPDIVLVETSGLAKPASLGNILKVLVDRGPAFDYAGMTCVVDAERYPALSRVVNAVGEQIRYSDRFIINKVDLVSKERVAEIEADIRSIHPEAPLLATSFCVVDGAFLAGPVSPSGVPATDACFLGWGDLGRPVALVLETDRKPPRSVLDSVLHSILPHVFRIKGSIDAAEGRLEVDGTDRSVSMDAAKSVGEARGLVVIAAKTELETVREAWNTLAGQAVHSPSDA